MIFNSWLIQYSFGVSGYNFGLTEYNFGVRSMQIESSFLPRFFISQNPKVCQNAPIIKDKAIRAN